MPNSIMMRILVCAMILVIAAPALAQETSPVAVLQSDASHKEKADACRILARQGGPDAVPALASLLTDEKLSHMARYALEPMPCAEAGDALRNALGKTSARLKVGIIHSLGVRGDTQAVPALVKLLSDGDAEVAQTAARALGRIATPEATKALEDAIAQANVPPGNLRAFCDGLFGCAETLAEEGQRDQAITIYDCLFEVPNAPLEVRTGALRGAVLTRGGKQGLPLLVKALHEQDDSMFAAALRVSRELDPEQKVTAALADELAGLPAERKIRLIQALGHRGGTAAGPAVLAAAKDGPTDVRAAALRALARMGYGPALELMEHLAWSEDGELAEVARNSLSYFPGEDANAALRAMLENEEAKARCVAIELIGQGGLDEPVDLLMKVAETDEDESVRVAALKTLGRYAGIEDLPGLLDRLLKARSQSETQAAENALGALCARQKRTPTGNVVIQKAVYGDLPDGPSADVTEKVAQVVKAGSMTVEASNRSFGDPAQGIVKELSVDYTEDGILVSKTVGEGETLTLTTVLVREAIVEAFCSALEEAQGESKLAVLRLLGSTGSRKALETVRTAASEGQGSVKETALRTLCEWPTPDALPALMELVKTSPDQTLRVLALRGAVRLLNQSKAVAAELLQDFAVLMDHARTADEKKTVLGGLAQVHSADALGLALRQFNDESVKAEAVQAAVSIARDLGKSAREDKSFLDLTAWQGNADYWRVEDGAIVGHSDETIARTEYLWAPGTVGDFYLSVEIRLEPDTCNSGIQFRSEKRGERGEAHGCQADAGRDVWGRLYDQGGRGKLDWTDRAEKAVKPGEWNRYEVLAVGPAIWTAINGQLGVACLDISEECERSGQIAFQLHAGPPPTVRYRIHKLVHDPKVELAGMTAEELIAELKVPER